MLPEIVRCDLLELSVIANLKCSFFAGAPVMNENTQPQVHVRCSDVNAVCEARKMVRSSLIFDLYTGTVRVKCLA